MQFPVVLFLATSSLLTRLVPPDDWTIAGYVLGTIFGLFMLMALFSILISSLIDLKPDILNI
jgi:hypothetical protein